MNIFTFDRFKSTSRHSIGSQLYISGQEVVVTCTNFVGLTALSCKLQIFLNFYIVFVLLLVSKLQSYSGYH